MKREELTRYLDEILDAGRFKDYCPNGLQVEGRPEIRSLVAGVTASQALLAVAGRAVEDPHGMLDLIAGQKPGEAVSFQLRRQNKLFDITVKIGKRAPQSRGDD